MSETKAKDSLKKTKPAPAQDIDKDHDSVLSEETYNDMELQSTISEETANNMENHSSLSEDTSSIDNLAADTNPNKIQISDKILSIDIDLIEPDPDQSRKLFDSETLNSLKNSIEKTSLQNPIFVLKNEQKPGSYIIVDGERRWRACKELNHAKIQCRVVASDSAGYQILSLTQNLQRENLLPIEIAEGYAKLLATMQASDPSVTQKSLMHIHHKKESAISELLKISKLPDSIKETARKSSLWSHRKLYELAKIEDSEKQMQEFIKDKAIIQKKLKLNDKVSDNSEPQSYCQTPELDDSVTESSDPEICDNVSSDPENSKQNKTVSNIISKVTALENDLNKCIKSNKLNESQKEEIKPKLLAILKLILNFLS